MGSECRDKVIADTERSSTDYRCTAHNAATCVVRMQVRMVLTRSGDGTVLLDDAVSNIVPTP